MEGCKEKTVSVNYFGQLGIHNFKNYKSNKKPVIKNELKMN